ncbi:hypothetical protein A2619_03480 [candidate division WWE3 bacterium RIFOXYD1_FULL_39_9]|uniref:Uncharacterized protein n=1 Tax=candidate division WWE3 bacterium RIFOXYD1_FULL_39_9 TaxID=1802649 RepID=A0A1F4X5N4_UNCKA|nr:MAG: hypothetical protein A2619_03480 [candidate division WWE3 bacterium RIFOXYD1_FULL_39_9]
MTKCPRCNGEVFKVIYYGLPFSLCKEEDCSCLFGFFDFIARYLPFNGWFYAYEGSYLIALICWLFGMETGKDE